MRLWTTSIVLSNPDDRGPNDASGHSHSSDARLSRVAQGSVRSVVVKGDRKLHSHVHSARHLSPFHHSNWCIATQDSVFLPPTNRSDVPGKSIVGLRAASARALARGSPSRGSHPSRFAGGRRDPLPGHTVDVGAVALRLWSQIQILNGT
jgi:hypothetical protein